MTYFIEEKPRFIKYSKYFFSFHCGKTTTGERGVQSILQQYQQMFETLGLIFFNLQVNMKYKYYLLFK